MDRDPKGGHDDTIAAPTNPSSKPSATDATVASSTQLDSQAPTLGGTPPPPPESWPSSTGIDPGSTTSSLMRYRLGAVLGRGGMGEVVSARDEQIGRSVAIKRMRAEHPTPEQTARFMREARIQGRLDHPAVVPVHELWHDAHGQPFFVMKQLTGVTLGEVLDQLAAGAPATVKAFTRQRLLRTFADVCLAIEFAHTKGVVHRDLKPANIVLGDFGEVYVLDWGIARITGEPGVERPSFNDVSTFDGSSTVAGAVLGTPGYMSPEQVRGDLDLDGRSDVYALGCILFELLALESLHPRGHAALAATLEPVDAKPGLRAPEREIAPELDAMCLAATMLERDDRYATARELGDAVQRFLDGDRDLAQRKTLANTELEMARAALMRGDGADERRIAIRAAARALALDPTAREPAELVGKLMLEPPSEVPAEVEAELLASEKLAMKRQARLSLTAACAYFALFPTMYLVGFRFGWYSIVGPLLVFALLGTTVVLARTQGAAIGWVTFAINCLLILLLSRIVTPFIIAPGLAVVSVMVYSMHPLYGPVWLIAAPCIAAVLVPLFAELLGWVSTTTRVIGGDLVLHLPSEHLNVVGTFTGLVIFIGVIVTMATMISRSLALTRRDIQRTQHVQAWQLRQLVTHGET